MIEAPLFDAVADGPEGGAAHWVTTADGLKIRVGHWTHKDAKATVLLFPGRTEYIEKYGRDARVLQSMGYATITVDWRGQGISDRLNENPLLGHVHDFHDYQHDVRAMVDHARELGLPEPFFLLAHSMGGCIGLRSLQENLPVKAACFSAPMWGIMMSAALRPVAWGISALSKPLGFGHLFAPGQSPETYVVRAEFDDNSLTSDRGMFEYMREQIVAHPELALGGPSLHWLNEALVEMLTLRRMDPPTTPTIAYYGTDEAIVDPHRIVQVMQRWKNGKLTCLQGARHEILMEAAATRTRVFNEIGAHFARHMNGRKSHEHA